MKRIYIFMFLSVWMFAACSSNSGTVKSDASATEPTPEAQAAAPAKTSDPVTAQATDPAPEKAASEAVKPEVFHHAGAGFSITKPADWKYMSPEMVANAQKSVKLNDAELEEMLKKNANAPLVVLTRYQEPYPTLNPSVSVTVIPLPVEGMEPKEVLKLSTEMMKRIYPDLTYVDEIQDTNVDDLNGAYAKVKYTVKVQDQQFPTTARMWLVPRGKVMFTVGMSGPQEGPDVSEEKFSEILKSIKITK